MKILITRPSPAGEQLVTKLHKKGKSAWHLPLINFSPGTTLPLLVKQLHTLSKGDLLFINSQNAINYANNWLNNLGVSWPTIINYYSIGRTSSSKMYKLTGFTVNYSQEGETSENLLDLPGLLYINGKRALILRGNNGRTLLEKTLKKRGAEVTCCECYHRYPINYNGEEQGRRMMTLGINALVITSGEMLQQLYSLMPEHYRTSWLINCKLIVVSERLAQLANQLGWKDIIVSISANNDALAQTLLKH